jgi:hypothetical protein
MFGPDIHDIVHFKILHKGMLSMHLESLMYAIKSIKSMLSYFSKTTYCKKLALKDTK